MLYAAVLVETSRGSRCLPSAAGPALAKHAPQGVPLCQARPAAAVQLDPAGGLESLHSELVPVLLRSTCTGAAARHVLRDEVVAACCSAMSTGVGSLQV